MSFQKKKKFKKEIQKEFKECKYSSREQTQPNFTGSKSFSLTDS